MNFDLKTAIASVAPTLATMLAGPMAGTAVAALANCFGLKPGADAAAVAQVIQGGAMTPEIAAAIRAADQAHDARLKELDIDLAKVNADHAAALAALEVQDRGNARMAHSGRTAVWWIASLTLGTFAITMSLVLYGCWTLLRGGITIQDVGTVAAISTLVGSVIGYVAANAQTVINFIFGGSLGSDKKTDAMAQQVSQALTAAAAAAQSQKAAP